MTKEYPLFRVPVGARALDSLRNVLLSGFINEGVEVSTLKRGLKEKLKCEYITLTNSCTSALTIALRLAGVSPGDFVCSTSMTCVATNTPILNLFANIQWADVDPNSGTPSLNDIKNAITEATKAVIIVAWAGTPPCELSEIYEFCKSRQISLILDAAHAFGAELNDEPIHHFADYTCYSFQAIKHFTTGDGGAVVCQSSDRHKLLNALKWFGIDREAAKDAQGNWVGKQWDVDIETAGYKFNMNNIAAALGLVQLQSIDEHLQAHRRNANLLDQAFINEPIKPIKRPINCLSSFWVYTVKVDDDIDRDQVLQKLNSEKIYAGIVHTPNHLNTAFKTAYKMLPGVDAFFSRQFSIPCGWWLDQTDIKHIIEHVLNAVRV